MDEFLNELYGTSQIISGGDDLEKQAAAEFLIKLAEQEGVDLDTLSDQEVGELLTHIEGGMGKQAQAQAQAPVDGEQEAREKLAEADFLGRAMAHAYVNELNEIEKAAALRETASKAYQAIKGALGRAGSAAKGGASAVGEWTGASQMGSGAKKALQGLKAHSAQAKQVKRDFGEVGLKNLMGTRSEAAKEGLKELGAGAARMGKRVAGPAAALETARRIGKAQGGSEKKSFSEEFEDLARERAYELLAEAGYDVEKVAQADVETAALQMLEAAGYPVNWNQG